MREWNQLDESIESSPAVSVFKRELMPLIRPPKLLLFGFHDIKEVRLLTRLQIKFSDLHKHRFRHNFQYSSPCPSARLELKIANTFACHSSNRRDLLDRISNVVYVDPENLSSTDLCNLLLHGIIICFWVDTNHHIIESAILFIKSVSRFKQI